MKIKFCTLITLIGLAGCYHSDNELKFYKQVSIDATHFDVYKYSKSSKKHLKTGEIYEIEKNSNGTYTGYSKKGPTPNFRLYQVAQGVDNFLAATLYKRDNKGVPSNITIPVVKRTFKGVKNSYCFMDLLKPIVETNIDGDIIQGPDKNGNYILEDTQSLYSNLSRYFQHFENGGYTTCITPTRSNEVLNPNKATKVIVRVTNNCTRSLKIAHRYKQESDSRREHTKGWDTLAPGKTVNIGFIDINPNSYYYAIKDHTRKEERYFAWRGRPTVQAVINRYSNFDLVNPIIAFLDGNPEVYTTFYKFVRSTTAYNKGGTYRLNFNTGCTKIK